MSLDIETGVNRIIFFYMHYSHAGILLKINFVACGSKFVLGSYRTIFVFLRHLNGIINLK